MGKRRVTCHRKFPTNELFKLWLEELKDKAASYGSQTQFVYGKTYKAIDKCVIELTSAEEAKNLDNIGDKTVKVLGDKLREFVAVYGPPTFDNIQLVGVKLDDADGATDAGANATPKKRGKRKSNTRQYIPGYRTGGYGILRALYDAYKDQQADGNGIIPVPFMEKRELILAGQRYCDEPMKMATRDQPYTAWNSVNTLIKHDLVKMNRAKGSTMQYALTKDGIEMAKRLTDAATDGGGNVSDSVNDSPPAAKQPKKTKSAKKNLPVSPVRPNGASYDPGSNSASPTRWNFNDYAPSSTTATKRLFTPSPPRSTVPAPKRLPSSSPPRYDDHDNGYYDDPPPYWYDQDPEPLPLAQRISDLPTATTNGNSEKSIKLGYIYIDSNGLETQLQEKAHVMIDESEGSFWYLVKTTDAYMQKVGRDRWRMGNDLPSSIVSKVNWEEESVLMYLKSEFADDFAPGIVETGEFQKPDSAPLNGATAASFNLGNADGLLAIHNTEKEVIEKPKTSTPPNRLVDYKSAPSTSTTRRFEDVASAFQPDNLNASPKRSTTGKPTNAGSDVIVLEPGSFEIILIVDHSEIVGGVAMFGEKIKNRKAFLTDGLSDLEIDYVKRRLPVGDYLFVAREKTTCAMNGAGLLTTSVDRELVLGPVIERKRMDDLASSIKDGRFHEQKGRLQECGVHKVIYLIEDFGRSMANVGMSETALRSAIIGTQVFNGFDVVRKKSSQEVTTYLNNLLSYLRERFRNKRLVSRQQDSLSVQELIDIGSYEIALPTFREFSELSAKRRPLTVGDAFARSLLQIPGVSVERAEAVRKVYPTLAHLMEAYEACGEEDQEDALLEAIPYGHLGRNLGSELSKRIARFFCAAHPFTK